MFQFKGSDTHVRSVKLPKILIVEDNKDHWTIIRKAMQDSFTEVEPVLTTSSQETIDYLTTCYNQADTPPKLILMDLYLPEREDGWELLGQIKTLGSPFDKLPIVVLSYSNNPDDIAESYRRGSNSYLVKPTRYQDWAEYFRAIKDYWWETVTLPNISLYQ